MEEQKIITSIARRRRSVPADRQAGGREVERMARGGREASPRRGGGEAGRRRGGGLAAGRWRGWPAAGSRGGRAGWAWRTTRANTARETNRAGGRKNYGGGQERSGTKSPSRRQFFPLPCVARQYFPRAAAFPAAGAFHACWTSREQISARFCACYARLRGDALLREHDYTR